MGRLRWRRPRSRRLPHWCYVEQVTGLRQYPRVPEVPADHYDVPIELAKRLLAYQRAITLAPPQRAVYDRAVKLSQEGGPCCCRCWHWHAFEGQAEFLIAQRGYRPDQIAEP